MKRLISLTITLLFILNGCSSNEKIGVVLRVSDADLYDYIPDINNLGQNEFSFIPDALPSESDHKYYYPASAYPEPGVHIVDGNILSQIIIPVDNTITNFNFDLFKIMSSKEQINLVKEDTTLGLTSQIPDTFSFSRNSTINDIIYSFNILSVSPLTSLTIFEYDEHHELFKTTSLAENDKVYKASGEFIVVEEIRGSSSDAFKHVSIYSKSSTELSYEDYILYTYYIKGEGIILNLSEVKIKW